MYEFKKIVSYLSINETTIMALMRQAIQIRKPKVKDCTKWTGANWNWFIDNMDKL